MATKVDASMGIYSTFIIDENSSGQNGKIFEIERFNDTLMMGIKLWNKETGKEFKFDKSISFPFEMGVKYLRTAITMIISEGKEIPFTNTNFDKTQTCSFEFKYTKDGGIGLVCKKEHIERGLSNFYVVFPTPAGVRDSKEEVKDAFVKTILKEIEEKIKETNTHAWNKDFLAKRYKKEASDSAVVEPEKYDDKPVESAEDFPF